jgi:hypothetical protein
MKYVEDSTAEGYITDAFGSGTPSDPVIGFADNGHTIFYEQWSSEGRWRGWCEEKLEPAEYFRRKLKGK